MPTSFQGIGTTYYGQRDFASDGSFITTEWVVFAGIPLVPLRSLRVCYQGAKSIVFPIIHSEEKYLVLSKMPVDWIQVASTYGFILFLIAWVVLLTLSYEFLARHFGETGTGILLFIAFVPAGLLPVGLRLYAKRKPRA